MYYRDIRVGNDVGDGGGGGGGVGCWVVHRRYQHSYGAETREVYRGYEIVGLLMSCVYSLRGQRVHRRAGHREEMTRREWVSWRASCKVVVENKLEEFQLWSRRPSVVKGVHYTGSLDYSLMRRH